MLELPEFWKKVLNKFLEHFWLELSGVVTNVAKMLQLFLKLRKSSLKVHKVSFVEMYF